MEDERKDKTLDGLGSVLSGLFDQNRTGQDDSERLCSLLSTIHNRQITAEEDGRVVCEHPIQRNVEQLRGIDVVQLFYELDGHGRVRARARGVAMTVADDGLYITGTVVVPEERYHIALAAVNAMHDRTSTGRWIIDPATRALSLESQITFLGNDMANLRLVGQLYGFVYTEYQATLPWLWAGIMKDTPSEAELFIYKFSRKDVAPDADLYLRPLEDLSKLAHAFNEKHGGRA